MTDEQVLVIPAAAFERAGAFQGFRPFSDSLQRQLLDPEHFEFRPRSQAELDAAFKQLIPYIVLRCGDELFHYTRGQTSKEVRLQARRSIGIGGHINPVDAASGEDPYRAGMLRELREEVEIQSPYRERSVGFIYDGRTPVGQVHLGVVHLLELDNPLVWSREAAIGEAGFLPMANLARHRDDFETWSQFVLEVLADHQ